MVNIANLLFEVCFWFESQGPEMSFTSFIVSGDLCFGEPISGLRARLFLVLYLQYVPLKVSKIKTTVWIENDFFEWWQVAHIHTTAGPC